MTETTPAPRQLVEQALLPLRVISDATHADAVGFVLEGRTPEILLHFEQSADETPRAALGWPGRLERYLYVDRAIAEKLNDVGVDIPRQRSQVEPLRRLRQKLYAGQLDAAQWVRFAKLLRAIGGTPEKCPDGVPEWMATLVSDVIMCMSWAKPATAMPHLTAPLFGQMLVDDGVAPDAAPGIAITALMGMPAVNVRQDARLLAGLDPYLMAHVDALTPDVLAAISAEGREALALTGKQNAAFADAVAVPLAVLAVDTSKGVRAAAIDALGALPPERVREVVPPALAKVGASRADDLVNYLATRPECLSLLDEAASANPKLADLITNAKGRHSAMTTVPAAELELPPFDVVPEESAEPAREKLAAIIAERLAATQEALQRQDTPRVRERLNAYTAVGPAEIDACIAVAEGRGTDMTVYTNAVAVREIAAAVPELTMVHVARMLANETDPFVGWLIGKEASKGTDLRTIEDVLLRAGVSPEETTKLLAERWQYYEPEVTWPWLAQNLDVLTPYLIATTPFTPTALETIGHFPHIPAELLGKVANVALGDSRVNRPLAQQLLGTYPTVARELAEQALSDGRAERRQSAAAWLASLAQPEAVPALRAQLAKEKREVVRAALLTALKASGDDLSDELSPERLLAEAVKGLKAKAPSFLEWFDEATLPPVRWADGSPVDPRLPQWWLRLAVKLKDPNGRGLLDLYLGLLDADDAHALGLATLDAWIAQDTLHPSDAESREHARDYGKMRYDNAQNWLERVRANPKWAQYLPDAEAAAALPVETHVARAYAAHQRTYVGSATADKGMIALSTRVRGIDLAERVQSYLRQHTGRRSQAESLIVALFANGQPAAIQVLLSVARRFKMKSVQDAAITLVEQLADERGWTPDELADRTIPSAGFSDDGLLHLSYGEREFIGRVSTDGKLTLSKPDGTALKALPDARADEDEELVADAKKQLSASRKEAKAVLQLQSARLYEAMCLERTWSASDWKEFLAGHPLVSQLVTRLIWVADPEGTATAFRPTEDGALVGVDDEPVDLPDGVRVGLAHGTSLIAEQRDAWRSHLADYAVKPLFDQLSATLPEADAAATEIADLQGHLTDTFKFRGAATKRGYQRGVPEDGGWFMDYTKSFASAGLTAHLWFTGSYLPEENIACALKALSFQRKHRNVPLGEVPRVLLAECYADYAAMAKLGPFDPDWERKAQL